MVEKTINMALLFYRKEVAELLLDSISLMRNRKIPNSKSLNPMKSFFLSCIIVSCTFSLSGQEVVTKDYSAYILTPPAPKAPRINGATVYGVRPGNPVIYRIPCTGERPISFAIKDLPEGLRMDREHGIISGSIKNPGSYSFLIEAENSAGSDKREMNFKVGDKIALTPPMGWNSWYIHYDRISDQLMREAADQMIKSGMADYGYQYVNIDDCWMVKHKTKDPEIGGKTREKDGTLITNLRFPDMKGMTDYIHEKGLKAGIYISPGPSTCAGYEGSYRHEEQDALTFADWGFDFLKYDWCSYDKKAGGKTREDLKKPYKKMWASLVGLDRDIVLNLCQYGMGNVWEWGAEVGNSWRTTGDLGLEERKGLPGFYSIGLRNAEHWPYAGPGAWNDPDYILIGWVGDARKMAEGTPTDLTPYEQYSYMSMWSLMAAPLIFSGDMAKLDPFTLNVLCNHEVIEVSQDPLGKQAKIVRKTDSDFVLVKIMIDGSLVVGLFNFMDSEAPVSVSWEELGISGSHIVRDLWRQKELSTLENLYETMVPPHGVQLVRIWLKK
ncbi:MAG: alpha-galactosidase [Bacteroidetes bacterium]|nr:MAG: alpha-galactosidase [Bacteroidota bacterium]RLD69572.1 MAG: alpha-galactosidase [Bacteroidota bacterium]